jgi:hypothetical protein
MWALDVDWTSPGSSTLTALPSIDVAEFSSELCGLVSFSCIPQPGTTVRLDPLREVIMHRLQYINHDDEFETLVGNFVVDISGDDQGGVRWFELRRTGGADGTWSLHQEGTYSIDEDSRWMGASSMDLSGNIALAYNVSSPTTFPGLRYTGRKADDPLGVMTAAETSIIEGTASSGTNRYGDYAAMGLDPSDDCTFWFTGEYNPASVWTTRWASFRFDQCGCQVSVAPPTLTAWVDEPNRVDLSWPDSDEATVTEYEVLRSRVAGGPYETIAVVPDSSPGMAGGADYDYADVDVSGGIEYFYVVVAGDSGACRSSPQNEVSAVPFGPCFLEPVFDGATGALIDISDTCGIHVAWNAAVSECGGSVKYNLYRATDPDFVPGPDNLLSGGIGTTGVLDLNGLELGTEYFYVARAVDVSNLTEETNQVKVSAVAGASGGQPTVFLEDFEDPSTYDDWTVTIGPGTHFCGEWELSTNPGRRPSDGSGQYVLANSYDCAEFLAVTSASLDSPPIDLTDPAMSAVFLGVDVYYNHFNGDDATIEVWDGSQWVVIWNDPDADVNATLEFDVTTWALGNPGFRVRFNYQNANFDRWYAVDNVRLGANVICTSGPAPLPAPDGAAATSPLRASRATVTGDAIDISWDAASCPSGTYNLLYGSLDLVAAYTLSGSECGIGAGAFAWNDVPAGDLFFLIVGGDDVETESSWGSGEFGERNGLTASGECGVTDKNVSAVCPAD